VWRCERRQVLRVGRSRQRLGRRCESQSQRRVFGSLSRNPKTRCDVPSCPRRHSALSRASCRHAGGAPHRPRGVERREGTADDHLHADHGPPAAPLRPPASESRPTDGGRDRRHGRARLQNVCGNSSVLHGVAAGRASWVAIHSVRMIGSEGPVMHRTLSRKSTELPAASRRASSSRSRRRLQELLIAAHSVSTSIACRSRSSHTSVWKPAFSGSSPRRASPPRWPRLPSTVGDATSR